MDSEQQIQDLNVTIELLTLDKEQLSIEKEILEEKVSQLESENHQLLQRLNQIPSINPDQLKEFQHLHHENNQLKELLQKEKDEKSSLQESFTTQQNQLLSQITELQQQVDSLSQFENIIEKLTNDNELLKLSLQENQKNIQVLEDALELNEQLDEQQRVQIDSDRKIIESYEVKMNHYEQKFIEKDILLQDIQKKLENMKDIYNQQKQENSDLHQLLLTENQQYQSFEEKLQLIIIYQKTIEQTVRNTLSDSQTMIISLLQKYRYQTTTTRYEQLYGNLSYSIEETKLLNHEILLLTTMTLNFDIQYQLSLLYSTIKSLQQTTSSTTTSSEDQHMAYTKVGSIVLQWCQLSVVLHQHLVHAIVQHLHPSSDVKEGVLDYKVILVLKNELEQFLQTLSHIVQQTVPLTTVHNLLPPPTTPSSNNEAVMVLSQKEADNYYSKLVDSFLSLDRLLQGYASSSTAELTSSASTIVKLVRFSAQQSGSSSASESFERPLHVEASCLLIEMIFEAIQTSMPNNNETEEVLRSARLELHTIFSSLDLSLAHHLTVLEASIKTIMTIFTSSSSLFINSYGVFSYPSESSKQQDTLKQLKEILYSLRQVNNSTNAADTGRLNASLQYYPSFIAYTFKALTNTTTNTTLEALLLSSETRQKLLQVDYYYLLDKYWKLLTQEHSELFSSSSTSIASASSISEEVAWKKRCSTIRDVVTDKLFSSSSHLKSENNDESETPRSPAGKGTIKDNKNNNTALQDLKKQLEIKNEELVIAKQRCLELQEVVSQSMIQLEAASAAAASTSLTDQYEAEKKRLQSEVKTLESALQTMEEKVDQLTRENKQLLKQGSAAVNDKSLAGSVSSSTAVTAKDKAAGRRRSNLDITDTKAIFSALASKEPATAIPSKGTTAVPTADSGRRGSVTSPLANTATVSASMLSVEAEKALVDQIQYWKTLSMKNITASLIPLPTKPSAESKVNDNSSKVQTIELSKELKAEIPQRYDDSMSNLKKVYYESRLQRVKAIKIPSLNSSKGEFEHKDVDETEKRSQKKLLMSKKYLYYHEPLLFQLVSTQQQ
eukprot:gene7188-7759_t